jgi:hypothetical protein
MAIIRISSPMTPFLRRLCAPAALGLIVAIAPVTARGAEPAPKPDTYLCPHATGGAVDCFLHAVEHLYTMCRQVKSIEIIEFGYEKSAEGTNGAKSEYCVDKHRLSITRPYQSALREATPNRTAVDGVRALYDFWLKALAELKWVPGESDAEYKARIAKPYEVFTERASAVRAVLVASNDKAGAAAGKGKAATAAATPPRTKSAN